MTRAERELVVSWVVTLAMVAALIATLGFVLELLAVPEYVIPPPASVWRGIVENRDLIWRHTGPTVLEIVYGFALGNGGAFLVALLVVGLRHPRRVLLSSAILLRSVPIVALTPVLNLWLGLGLAPKVTIVALITFFPTLVITVRGLASVDPLVLDLMRTLKASPLQIFLKIRIPASMPYVFAGLKVAAPTAVVGALVAEWLASSSGIGHLMAVASYEFRTELLWATIVVASLLGVAAFAAVAAVEHWLVPWSGDALD